MRKTAIVQKDHRVPNHQLGASMLEYALLISLVAAVCVPPIFLLGTKTNSKLSAAHRGFDGDAVACTGGNDSCGGGGGGSGGGD